MTVLFCGWRAICTQETEVREDTTTVIISLAIKRYNVSERHMQEINFSDLRDPHSQGGSAAASSNALSLSRGS